MPHKMTLQVPGALLALLAAAAIGVAAVGCNTQRQGDVPPLERRAQEINKSIMCPVCPGESIDQSQNALAKQMRTVVMEKLQEGWEEEQIRAFFVERYGPRVLMAPPREGFNVLAWALPPFGVLIAIGAVYMVLRRMRKPPAKSAEEAPVLAGSTVAPHADYARRLEGLLGLEGMPDETSDNTGDGRRQEGAADG